MFLGCSATAALALGLRFAPRLWEATEPVGATLAATIEDYGNAALRGRRGAFERFAGVLIADRDLGVSSVRLVSGKGLELLRVPGVAPARAGRLETVRLARGGVVELRFESAALPVGFGYTAAGVGLLLTILIASWARFRVVRPLDELCAKLPFVAEGQVAELLSTRGSSEITDLARDLHRLGTSIVDRVKTSHASLVAMESAFERLHTVLSSLGEGVLAVDVDGAIMTVNDVSRGILALDVEDPRGESVFDYMDDAIAARLRPAMAEAREGSATVTVHDLRIGERVYDVSVAPLREPVTQLRTLSGSYARQAHRGCALVFLDMTQMYEVNRMKDEFLSSVSHELRTPLTSIQSFTEILLHMTPDEEDTWKEFLEIVSQESQRLTRLVNQVLDLARIQAGKMEFHVESVDVKGLIAESVSVFEAVLAEKGGSLDTVCDDREMRVDADWDRLRQVMTNLIGNACKFLPERGRVVVTASCHGPHCRIAVEDSGPGVRVADREQVFSKFRQGGDVMTDKPEGTGLGLAICREIVERAGGTIWCEESRELGGAAFVFELPVSVSVA